MIYRNLQDLKLSALGMGTMRLPVVDGRDNIIDIAETENMAVHAMAQGIKISEAMTGFCAKRG